MKPDEPLLRKAQRGDPEAFERLIVPYESRMYALALRMMKSEEDARDACQEALIRMYRSLPGFKGDSALSTWMHRIVANLCLDALRRKAHAMAPLDLLGEEGMPLAARDETPEDQAVREEMRGDIEKAIRRLPDAQRTAIVLRDIQGYSYEEIALALDINLNTVKSRISRARGQLRSWLSEAAPTATQKGCLT